MSSTEHKKPRGIRQVNCPTCQKIVAWHESNKFRPFCSKKCQLLDFGDWASEKHAIPGETLPENPDDDREL